MADGDSTDHQLELAVRLLDNDEDVLEEILRAFGPPVLFVLRQKFDGVLTREDIEDVVSIALDRLWQSRQRYDDRRGSLKTWLFAIAENAARDVLKLGWHKARELECDLGKDFDVDQLPCAATDDPPSEQPRAAKSPSRAEADLRDIVEALPEVQRRIVSTDAHAKDRVASSEWLAEELGIPVGTVRVYRKRAMDRIRAEMRKRGHDVP